MNEFTKGFCDTLASAYDCLKFEPQWYDIGELAAILVFVVLIIGLLAAIFLGPSLVGELLEKKRERENPGNPYYSRGNR